VIVYERPIRFEEVDAAGIVFFARYPALAHEAMEHLFGGAEGGYVGLITERRVGFPAVKLTVEYHAPVRYGDTLRIETRVARLGKRSLDLAYTMLSQRGERVCDVLHTVVVSDLVAMRSIDMPPDVRALLEAHHRDDAAR
jgi:4-hydroxybenzoyl-CoA thioesterase